MGMVASYTFGSIKTSTVPLVLPIPNEVLKKDSFVGLIHLRKASNLLVCCDDDSESVHYFFLQDDAVDQCLWSGLTNFDKKREILADLRGWFKDVYDYDLEKGPRLQTNDVVAWEWSP